MPPDDATHTIRGPVLVLGRGEPTADPRLWRGARSAADRGLSPFVVAGSERGAASEETVDGVRVRRVRVGRVSAPLRDLLARRDRRAIATGSADVFEAPPASHVRRGEFAGLPTALWGIARMVWRTRALLQGARGVRPALVHAHDDETWLAGWWVARRANAPLVLDAHEIPGERRADWGGAAAGVYRLFWRPVIRSADAVVTVSDDIAEYLKLRYSIPRPTVVRSCPPLLPGPGPRTPPDGPLRVLYHGLYDHGRGLESLLEAASRVPGVELRMRGMGTLEHALRAHARRCGLDPDAVFLPPVPMSALVEEAAAFDVGAVPAVPTSMNKWLASPNKLFEYCMAALCVVASDLPTLRGAISSTGAGFLYPPGDVDALASLLDRLASSPELVTAAAERARAAAETEWNWEVQFGHLLTAYRGAIQARP